MDHGLAPRSRARTRPFERPSRDPRLAALLPTDWRFVILAGGSAGLAAASIARPLQVTTGWLLLTALAGLALALARPREITTARTLWLLAVAALAAVGGLAVGADRIAAIDRGAVAIDGQQKA